MDEPPSSKRETPDSDNDLAIDGGDHLAQESVPPIEYEKSGVESLADSDEHTVKLPEIPRGPALNERARSAAAGSDSKAQKEADQFGSKRTPEQLASDAAELEHGRTQRFRDAFEHMAIGALIVGCVTILVLAVIWALHLVMPPRMRWLSSEDLTHIQTLLTAGVLVGVVSSHFKKRLGEIK